jgi:hypothetical protein
MKNLDHNGHEIPDPTPMAPPVGYKRQPTLVEQIRNMIRSEKLAAEAQSAGFETFEEADDFDVEDDYDPHSPFENDFEPPVSELKARAQEESRAALERGRAATPPDSPSSAGPLAPAGQPQSQ